MLRYSLAKIDHARNTIQLHRLVQFFLRDQLDKTMWQDPRPRPFRMGFVWDVVGYGARTARDKKRVQQRLPALANVTLSDLGVTLTSTDWQGTGDGILVFLPKDLDFQRSLPQLLRSTVTHLAADNDEFRDQVQLRVAVDIGPVGAAQLGFDGAVATNLGRLVNSAPPRKWLADSLTRQVAVVVSDRLHSFVVGEDMPGLPPEHFTHIDIQIKEVTTTAWLWTGHDPTHH